MTEDFEHEPVMEREVVAGLQVKPDGVYADGTVGGAGHARALLLASSPRGWLYGCDADREALEHAARRLADFTGRFELRQGNFGDLAGWVPRASCDGIIYDLGVSSHQLDVGRRGFSFLREGPLDMRLNQQAGMTAADLVNTAGAEELARIFWEYGGERQSRRFAAAIVRDRETRPFSSTTELAELLARLSPRMGQRTHPATKVFQALRVAVNDELGSLRRGLAGALQMLRPGGRLAVICFQSLEDRLVKEFGRVHSRGYTFEGEVDVPELRQPCPPELRLVTRHAIEPSAEEVATNPRSRSAHLRVMERLGVGHAER